jgi:hypothetical protein
MEVRRKQSVFSASDGRSLIQSHLEIIRTVRAVENGRCVEMLHDNPTSRSPCYNGRDVRHTAMKSKKKMKVSTNPIEGF